MGKFPSMASLMMCMVLACLTGGALSQDPPSVITFDMYIFNMTYDAIDDIVDKTSGIYNSTSSEIKETLSPIGGESEDITFSNGGGCLKVHVSWKNGNDTAFFEMMNALEQRGIRIWLQTWAVSHTGCPAPTVLRATFFVVGMTYSDNFRDQNSAEYLQVKKDVVNSGFNDLGGSIRALEIRQNYNCLEFYVEWAAEKPTSIIHVMWELNRNGIMIMTRNYTVQAKACSGSATVVSLTFYVTNLQWSDSFKDVYSEEYYGLRKSVIDTFDELGGDLRSLQVDNNSGCVMFYVEWNALNATTDTDLMSEARMKGFVYNSKTYAVQPKPCTVSSSVGSTLLRLTFYVDNLLWSDNFMNQNSVDFVQMKSDVAEAFISLNGSIRSFEITKRNGCVEFYAEIETLNSASIFDLMSLLNKDGITLMGQSHTVQSQPCSANSAAVVRFSFYVANLTWSDNFQDRNSTEFQEMKQTVEVSFAGLGGSIRALEIAQNSGCTEMYVEWNALNSAILFDLMSSLKTSGFNYRTQNYDVQSKPCVTPGDATVVRFTFYVANLTWSDNFQDRNSTEFQEMKQTVEVSFTGLGGSIRALEIVQNSGCTEFYVEWNALNSAILFDLMSSLKTSGFNYRNQNYDVQSKPCVTPGSATVVRFTFYVANLTLSDNFQEGNSEYQKLKQTVENTFTGLGGSMRNLVIVKQYSCVEFYVEWNALNTAILFDLMSTLKKNGFTYESQNYAVESKPCTAPTGSATVVRFKFYVASLTWSDNFQDRNSTEFQEMKQTVEVSFAGLGGSIRALEIAQSSGCVEFYVEWNALTPDIVFDLISSLKTNGFTYDFQNYDVQSSSCTGQGTVLRYRFYVVNMTYSSNFANQSSQEYQLVKQAVQAVSTDLGGNIRNLEISQNYGCILIYVEWDTNNPTNIMGLMSSLLRNGINIIDKHYTVRSTPCTIPPADIDACPQVTGLGPCLEACGDFMNCSDGFKCCSNGCGHICQRVGYVLMIRATIVTNKTWEKDMDDVTSMAFMEMKLAGKMMIQMLNLKNPTVVKDVELTKISRIIAADGQNYTTMDVEVYLTQDLPNAELKSESDLVRNAALNLLDGPVNIVSMDWENTTEAETSLCDDKSCSGICKELRSGEQYCSCNPGYTGADCTIQETTDVCAMGLCINGGTCHNMPGGTHHCECPDGFSGSVCQDAVNHCREGQPLMTPSGEATCFRGQRCPTGFMCNVDPLDRWTACCFDKGFLCDSRNPCQAGGECVADFMTGKICRCSPGRLGVFCEKAGNAPALTECQQRQQFGDLVISILQTGTSQLNVTLQDMQQILQHQGYEYYPTDFCDEQGEYKATTQAIQVANPSAPTVDICLDKSGNYDPSCKVAVCEILTVNNMMEFCFNGGRCLGDITQKLCNCTGTGYHGAQCELSGESGETDCTSRRDVAYLTIGALNGSVVLMPGFGKDLVANTAKSILAYAKMDNIFVPYCDNDGKFEYRGCTYMVNDTSRKTCSCATEDGSNYGDETSTVEPPWNCIEGPNSCPPEWGSDCEKPKWWCTDEVQCNRDSERCAFFTQCTNSFCKQEPEVGCVDKGKVLACDPQPCTDDPFSNCNPCGAQGTCYNVGTARSSDSINYRCECNLGYSGAECEINDTFCAAIPQGLCKSHCIGDLSSGQLCHCGIGYGGVFCDKPARTPCQRRKALFDDIINFISKKAVWNDVSMAQMADLVKYITKLDGGDEIPVLNCTATGLYAKVQCMVATNNLDDKQCNCVDYEGNYISSNVKAYIGYDICTAPSDFQELAESACSVPAQFGLPESSPCHNGGQCVFDIYAGKFCSCPNGYSGLFCQIQGNDPVTAQSLCTLYSGAWDVLHAITTGKPAWIVSDVQRQIYLNITQSFLMSQKNESWALKAECKSDGTFKPVQCFYNIKTGDMGSCYCWNPIGLLTEDETPVSSTDSDKCSARSACPMMKCVPCEHGYRQDNLGCRTCDCKNPCEEMTCGTGERCVIETSMAIDTDDSCTKAVCRSANKQGTCPGYANSTLPTTPGNDGSCIVNCYDDTDCDGAKKCCGQCSRVCILPQDVDRCLVPHSTQRCQDYVERHFYNSTTKRCEKFMFAGCSPDLNNFESFEECCNNCSKEGQCKKGQCPAIKPGVVATCVNECSADGDCAGQLICCSNGCGTTCVVPDDLIIEKSNCLERQMEAMRSQNLRMEANIDGCNVWNIPVCEQNGTWAREQCQVALGICWCVSPNGNYINNTITRGPAQCQKVLASTMTEAELSNIDMSGVNFPVCDRSMDFHCCPTSVCSQTCTAYPDAVCHINPCGGCKAEFYNAEGKMVNCSEGLSPCQQELGLVTNTATDGKGYPEQCKLKPDTGDCKGYQLQWYFDPATARCNQFVWGLCGGNGNRFNTPEECYGTCAPTLSPCWNVSCENVSTSCKLNFADLCQATQKICELTPVCVGSALQQPFMGKNPFVPSCDATGEYSYKQCYGSYCWCTNKQGQYINGLTTEQTSSLTCSENGALQSINSTNGVCPNGNQPNMNCVKACTGKMCLSHPTAKCVADLCSADCSTKFVDAQDQEVVCADKVPCPGTRVEACPESICDVALKQNCSKNPCAVCMVDQCTCQAYFVDARTHKKLTPYQCSYLTMGLCEVDACNILSNQEKAKISKLISSNTYINLPDCEANGIYKPKQCQSPSSCRCVNQYGETIKESPNGSCKSIDKIMIINATFIYDADFNSFKSNNELNLFKAKFMAKLNEVGIDMSIIKYISEPYAGSIKINISIQCNPESCDRDLALIAAILKKLKLDNNNELDLLVNGKPVKLMDITNETRTESQVASENNSKNVNTSDGLTESEKIIIGVVCGAVGLLVLGIIAYCLCCRRRSQKKSLDTSSEHSRSSNSSPSYHKSEPVYNKAFEEDSVTGTVKERL